MANQSVVDMLKQPVKMIEEEGQDASPSKTPSVEAALEMMAKALKEVQDGAKTDATAELQGSIAAASAATTAAEAMKEAAGAMKEAAEARRDAALAKLETERAKTEGAVASARILSNQVNDLTAELSKARDEHKKTVKALETEQNKVVDLEKKVSHLAAQVSGLNSHNDVLQKNISRITTEIGKKQVSIKTPIPAFSFEVTARETNGAIKNLVVKPK